MLRLTNDAEVMGPHVNGRAFKPEVFRDALQATKETARSIDLLVVSDEYYQTVSVKYQGGERYPHLAREEGKPDVLSEIMKPLAKP